MNIIFSYILMRTRGVVVDAFAFRVDIIHPAFNDSSRVTEEIIISLISSIGSFLVMILLISKDVITMYMCMI